MLRTTTASSFAAASALLTGSLSPGRDPAYPLNCCPYLHRLVADHQSSVTRSVCDTADLRERDLFPSAVLRIRGIECVGDVCLDRSRFFNSSRRRAGGLDRLWNGLVFGNRQPAHQCTFRSLAAPDDR